MQVWGFVHRLPGGALRRCEVGRHQISAARCRRKSIFTAHLSAREIKNPFQGLPALEAAIGRKVVARIGSNESIAMPRHPLDGVLPKDMLDLCRLYPDPYARDLRAKLARLAPGSVLSAEQVVVDNGADSLLFLILRTRVVPGDVVVTSAGTYPTFNYFSQGLGAEIVEVPYSDDGATSLRPHLEGLALAAKEKRAAVVYLANPDNPTGHVFSPGEVKCLRENLPAETTLIVDEAYIDFSTENALDVRLPNTVQVRTLSKAYGLAGLRVGFAIADAEWVDKADQIRVQFTGNSLTNALASKVLDDAAFARDLMSATMELRAALKHALASKGACVLPSSTNFVAVRYSGPEDAGARQAALLKEGIAVHRPPHPCMQSLLRVTASPQALDPLVIDVLTK